MSHRTDDDDGAHMGIAGGEECTDGANGVESLDPVPTQSVREECDEGEQEKRTENSSSSSSSSSCSSSSPSSSSSSQSGDDREGRETQEEVDLTGLLFEGLALGAKSRKAPSTPPEIASLISSARNIIIAAGAGISVASGIPDFRSPTTGLYANLQKYSLPHPEAIFEIDFFRSNPQPFYTLSKELYDPSYRPTKTHYFIKLLHMKGLLTRCYTQNIDSLESKAGVPKESVIAAHGNFDSAGCIDCGKEVPMEVVGEGILEGRVVRCEGSCGGLVKPSIVFFGEQLPARFWSSLAGDFGRADLLIVMGSSLVVQPFASLVERVKDGVPRVLINREAVGRWKGDGSGAEQDYMLLGDCDEMIEAVCEALGWGDTLRELVAEGVE